MNESGILAGLRVGFGFGSGRLAPGHELRLGGVLIDQPQGLAGPGDGDVVCLAVLDALLAAGGLPDVGTIFPDDDPELSDTEALILLSKTATALLRQRLSTVLNLSVRVLAPPAVNLRDERGRIQTTLAAALQVEPGQVAVGFGDAAAFAGLEPGVVVAFAHLLAVQRTAADRPQRPAPSRQAEMFRDAAAPVAADADGATAVNSDDTLPDRARRFEQALRSKLPPLPPAPPPAAGAKLIVYTDGACRGNPGPSATGWVVLDEQGRLVGEGGSALGRRTNNQAEYLAVQEAAQWIEEHLGRELRLEFRLDSDLAVRQITGQWKIKDAALRQLALEVMNQLGYFSEVELKHVPREENQRADALANKALGAK